MSVKIFSQFCNFCVPAAYSCRREGGDMVGFITLRGSLSGSIRLTTVGKSTRFVLKLREKPPHGGFTVYLIDGEDFASFRFSDDSDEFSGTALFSCVRAAVIANPFGDFIAEGSIGAVRHDLQAVKARIRAAAFSKERNAMQRNRHDSTQCTADLQISENSAENSKHLSAAVSGRTGGTEPGKSGQKRRDMRPSEKKAISPNSALPPNGLLRIPQRPLPRRHAGSMPAHKRMQTSASRQPVSMTVFSSLIISPFAVSWFCAVGGWVSLPQSLHLLNAVQTLGAIRSLRYAVYDTQFAICKCGTCVESDSFQWCGFHRNTIISAN